MMKISPRMPDETGKDIRYSSRADIDIHDIWLGPALSFILRCVVAGLHYSGNWFILH